MNAAKPRRQKPAGFLSAVFQLLLVVLEGIKLVIAALLAQELLVGYHEGCRKA